MRRRLAPPIGVAVFGLVFAACGGDTPIAPAPVPATPANRAPRAVGNIPNQELTAGGNAVTLAVSANFTDPDGDVLAYAATSSAPAVIDVEVSGAELTLIPVAAGTAMVTLTATDPGGLGATQTFGVTVESAAEDSGLCRNSRATPSGSSAELLRDCGILLEARDALQGQTRERGLNWNADLEIGSWNGVRSTPDGVIRLHLWNWGLAGTIPDSLGSLTSLEELNLTFNSLTGTIPDSLGNLTNLRILALRDNDLTGTIPASLGNLRNLELLYLWDNNLTGAIPHSLGNLTNLLELLAWDNDLTGALPDSLGNLSNLLQLSFGQNDLTGAIPDSLGNLTNLQHLGLYSNDLFGVIPDSLGNLTDLQQLRLSSNSLTGSIPDWLGNLTQLDDLDLSGNALSGAIPDSLGNLTNLEDLDLSRNNLTGAIPGSLGNLSGLSTLFLNRNGLTGCIPSALSRFLGTINPQSGGDLPVCGASGAAAFPN